LSIPGVENWTREDIAIYFEEPCKLPIRDSKTWELTPSTTPNVPEYVVAEAITDSVDLFLLCLKPTSVVNLKICDFSESFLWTNEPKNIELGTPWMFAAPEVIFKEPVTPAVDVWSLAVVMYGIPTGGSNLFPTIAYFQNGEEDVLYSMVSRLGKLPERLWAKWEERGKYFDADGKFIGDAKSDMLKRLEHKIRRPRQMSEQLIQFISMMVCYEPEERLSADEIVRMLPEHWLNGPWENIVYSLDD